ncbi:hypothetical protein [Jiella sp. M17.18]|uniref:hypothetical protein n=1 Tax=Jiella sp. M17.18 TaxID=3234247 RepID=UPI0034DF12A5
MTLPALLIAAVSGVASALLFAGLVMQSGTAFSLALAAPIPIAIASLGWGSLSGLISALVSGLFIYLLTGSASSALLLFAAMTGPTAAAGYLAGLARPSAAPQPPAAPSPWPARQPVHSGPVLDWYPLERIFLILVLLVVAACLFLGWLLGYDPDTLRPMIADALSQGGSGAETASRAQIEEIARLVVGLVPFVQPAVLTITLVIGLYLGAVIVRISGRLPRPKDDLPTMGRLPAVSLAVFALALAGSFFGGTFGLIADVFVGAFGAAFMLVGLAALHKRTRGRPGRAIVLVVSYAAILLLSFPAFVFLLVGIYETWRGRTPAPPSPPASAPPPSSPASPPPA